jgi:hypothetical protein
MKRIFLICTLCALLVACTPTATPSLTPQVITVYASAATQSWLNEIYTCAPASVVIQLSDTESTADIRLRLGEPDLLTTPAYQIDTEELLVVTHRESQIQNLNVDQVRALFAQGQGDVQIWVFGAGEDVQQVFEREIMRGTPITSQARLATDPQQMSDTLNNEKNAVGILPKHWKVGSSRFVFALPDIPVLAIVNSEPQGALKEIIACLQK